MKVLYILHSTIRQAGATKSFLILLNGLIRKGVTPTVVVPDRNGVFEDLQKAGIETIALSYRAAAYPPIYAARDYLLFLPRTIVHQYLNWRASRKLYQMLKNRSFDIIHTNVSVIGLGFKLSRRLSVPHIYHFREYADKDFRLYYFPSKKRIFPTSSGRIRFASRRTSRYTIVRTTRSGRASYTTAYTQKWNV